MTFSYYIIAWGGFILECGYLKNRYLKGLLTSKMGAMAISKKHDGSLKINLKDGYLDNFVFFLFSNYLSFFIHNGYHYLVGN